MTTLAMPVVSAITAGVLLILQMVLMMRTALTRRSAGVSLGEGADATLLRRSRRHGNLAENAAIFIAGFTLIELMGEHRPLMEIACAVFLVARLLHVIGLSRKSTSNLFRILGVIGTFAVGIGLGLRLIQLALAHLGS